jgi:hypothetical protein
VAAVAVPMVAAVPILGLGLSSNDRRFYRFISGCCKSMIVAESAWLGKRGSMHQ